MVFKEVVPKSQLASRASIGQSLASLTKQINDPCIPRDWLDGFDIVDPRKHGLFAILPYRNHRRSPAISGLDIVTLQVLVAGVLMGNVNAVCAVVSAYRRQLPSVGALSAQCLLRLGHLGVPFPRKCKFGDFYIADLVLLSNCPNAICLPKPDNRGMPTSDADQRRASLGLLPWTNLAVEPPQKRGGKRGSASTARRGQQGVRLIGLRGTHLQNMFDFCNFAVSSRWEANHWASLIWHHTPFANHSQSQVRCSTSWALQARC